MSTPTSFSSSPAATPSPAPTLAGSSLSSTSAQYSHPPDEFVQDGITYVRRGRIASKGYRLGSSHIWKYGLQYVRGSDKKEVYYCHECVVGKHKQELFVINGTTRVRSHLEQKHQIDSFTGMKKSCAQKSVFDQQKDGAASNVFFWKDSIDKFKELLIRWIVCCHIAFFQLENQYFRELLFFLNPALMKHLPKAARTIRSWVMNAFVSKKQQLMEELHQARSRISISFDLWTSPNAYAVLGVVAMWIDATGRRRSTVLGMRRVYGEHSGEAIGSIILELLKEYDVGGELVGYFMLDNASSNDAAVEFILKDLCPWMSPIDAPDSASDLYELYISTDRLYDDGAGCEEAIAFWLCRYDSQRDLARFALDMFAISPMSDECERLFSSAKLTVVDRRGRMKADIIEACECL